MNIFETLPVVKRIEKLCEAQDALQTQIDKIKRKNTNIKFSLFRFAHWATSALFWILVIVAFTTIIELFKSKMDFDDKLIVFIMCSLIAGIPVLLYFIFKDALIKHERKRAYTKKEQIVYNELEKQYMRAEDEINLLLDRLQTSEIPYKYWSSYALEWMIEAIRCKRANSLTELINLYEQFADSERRHNEQLETLYRTRTNVNVDVWVY